MKKSVLKGIAVAILVASTAAVQAVSFTGSIAFNPDFTMVPNGLGTVTQLTPTGPMALSGTPNGAYTGVNPLDATFHGNINGGLTLDLTGSQAFELYSFTWTVGGQLYRYSLSSLTFSVVSQGQNFLNVLGTGTAYIKYVGGALDGQNAYDPSQASWTLTGTQANGAPTAWGLSTTATGSIPDGGTTLMLLGLALSGLGLIRNKLS